MDKEITIVFPMNIAMVEHEDCDVAINVALPWWKDGRLAGSWKPRFSTHGPHLVYV
jgi:hypothetical protein